MYFYWSHVPQNVDGVAPSAAIRPRPLTDLYAQWFGVRELLLHHRDPYGAGITHELQVAYYGKDLEGPEAHHLSHQQRFAYPLYVVFLLAPTVEMQFHTVQTIFLWLLAAVTAASVPLWLHALRLKLSPIGVAGMLVLVFTSIPVMQGLGILQLGLLVAALLAGATAAAVSGYLFLAGVLLAFATIKPQMSVLAIAWFALWVWGDWRQRRALLWGFVVTLSALVIASELLLPGWVRLFLTAVFEYGTHMHSNSLLGVYLPAPLAWLVALFGFFMVAIYAWRARRQFADSFPFGLSLAFSLSLTLLVIPAVFQSFNQILLLPTIALTIRCWSELHHSTPLFRFLTVIVGSICLLPWLSAVTVTIGLLIVQMRWLLKLWFFPLNTTLAFPVAAFGMLLLLHRVVRSSRL
jgi:Glycosyltransferase family 87